MIIAGVSAVFIVIVLIVNSIPQSTTPPEYSKANFACTEKKEEFLSNKLVIPAIELGAGSEKIFEIDTETGTIDSLPRIINVYKYDNPGLLLNSQDTAKGIAKKLGFVESAIVRSGTLDATTYSWEDTLTSRKLVIKAKNLNFQLTTDFTKSNVTIDRDATLPTDDQAISKATEALRGLSKLSEDYAAEKAGVTYLSIEPDGSYRQVKAKSDADLIRVDFIRKKSVVTVKVDAVGSKEIKETLEKQGFVSETESLTTSSGKYDVYSFKTLVAMQDPFKSYLSVYVGVSKKVAGSNTAANTVYQIDYTNWSTEPTPCGTYELTPPSVALENIKRGEGSLVYLREKNADTVVTYPPQTVTKFNILEVKLMYYDSRDELPFMQPIYRIKGLATLKSGISGEFYYYIPAINYDVVKDKQVVEEVETPTNTGGTSLF